MSRVRADRYTDRAGTGSPTFSEGVNVVGVSSLGITTVTGVGQTALTVNGDARITGVLTVGQGSVTIDGTSGSSSITGVTTVGINSAYLDSINNLNYPTAGPLSNRNLIINGAMNVAQRGTSFTSTSSGYKLDRFRFGDSSPGIFDVVRSSTAPAGFSNSLKVDCTTTVTPSGFEEMFIETKIEAQDLQHLQYGTSGAQSVTLSFHVKSNKTGSYGLWVYQEDAASQYATTYTISSADTWEYKTITIPGNTAAVIDDDTGTGLNIRFYLLAGSNYAGTPAETWTTTLTSNRTTSLNLGDNTANEWLITGVQLEVGTRATPFEHRSEGDELARCRRYYYRIYSQSSYNPYGFGWNNTVSTGQAIVQHPVEMRAAPSSMDYSNIASGVLGVSDVLVTTAALNTGTNGKLMSAVNTSSSTNSFTTGFFTLIAKQTTSSYIGFEAEL